MLSRGEKLLYHQTHPLKLAVDIATSLASTWLLWRQASARAARRLGRVDSRNAGYGAVDGFHWATRLDPRALCEAAHDARAEAVRFGGQFVMWFGAWFHAEWAIAAGVVVSPWGGRTNCFQAIVSSER